ncbi:cytochrome P450 [Apiospora kogelbergensis]|uniref:cytochrome P450 n=1 Tax=Apiospora kogelbergensis TaxID=1337665 RepID=UPI00313273C6
MRYFMIDVAARPELAAELRADIGRALRVDGWKKAALNEMKLLNSTTKESQRHKPLSRARLLRRLVTDTTVLSGGVTLQPDDRTIVGSQVCKMDEAVYRNPGNLKSDLFRSQGHAMKLMNSMILYPVPNGAATQRFAAFSPLVTEETSVSGN